MVVGQHDALRYIRGVTSPHKPRGNKRATGSRQADARRHVSVRDFLAHVPEVVRARLPEHLQDFRVRGPSASLVKLYYGSDARIHYEVWLQRRAGRVEIGLHFEADPDTNSQMLSRITEQYAIVSQALGPNAEPEQWTASWTRVHESIPFDLLDEALLNQIADRLSRYIMVLEPMVSEAMGRA